MSQFQKYWLSRVNHFFFRASKPFRRTNPDFFTKTAKNQISGRFPPLPSTRDVLDILLFTSA